MSTWRPEIDVVLSDSEDEEDAVNFNGREAMLLVVDAKLSTTPDLFAETLKLVQDACISGIVLNNKDLLGVMFANTEKSPAPFEPNCLDNICMPDNCAVLLPMRQLTKPIAEHLLNFIRTAPKSFDKDFGIAPNGGSFADMIRLSVDLFKDSGFSLNSSIIVYLTNQALPHAPHTHEHQRALQKAKDLEGCDIDFKLIPMVDDLDYELFYKEFLTLAGHDPESIGMSSVQRDREMLRDRKLQQNFLARSLGHFEFTIAPSLVISAQFYNYFRRSIYPHKVVLLRKNNAIIKKKEVIMLREHNEESMEFTERPASIKELHYEIKLGGQAIRITREQLERVRNLHPPGMMLLGFKPLASLPEHWYSRPCNFMYPDDKTIVGSKRLFAALWQRCLEREKIAICLFMSRRRSNTRYVALIPVTYTGDGDGASSTSSDYPPLIQGDGFKIMYLPMSKHIRRGCLSHFEPLTEPVPPEGIKLFEKVVSKLRIEYDPYMIQDPRLKQLQDNLLALALNIQPEDDVLADDAVTDAQQDARIAELIPRIDEIFGVDEEKVAKRRAIPKATGDNANAAKKPKVNSVSLAELRSMADIKKLHELTVAVLRAALEEHFTVTMPKSATKQVLLHKLYQLCS